MMTQKELSTPPQTPKRRNFMEDTRVRFVCALVLAVLAWLIVVTVIQPNTEDTIVNVPVNFSYDSTRYTGQGLSIMNDPSATVSLKVSGDGAILGGLEKEDFVVYPDYSFVDGAGEVSLKLLVKAATAAASNVDVSIAQTSRAVVDIVFDTVEEIELPVTLVAENVQIADGFVLVKQEANQQEVRLTGPTSELEKIVEIVALYTSKEPLSETTTAKAQLHFLDKDGDEIAFEYVMPDRLLADVTLTVYKQAELPVTVSFINAPSNFDASVLKYTFSHETLKVAGNAKAIDLMNEISVGVIDLSTFALDKVYELPIELPDGITLQDNISMMTVSFDCTEMAIKSLNVPKENIQVRNLPSTYQLEIETNRIMNVEICGPKEVVESLSPESVVAVIDAEEFSIALGSQNIVVHIYVPSNGKLFAIGSYTVQCKIESH